MIFPVILGIVGMFGGRMVSQRKLQQEALSKLSDLIQEDLSGISAIKIYAQEDAEIKQFNTILECTKEEDSKELTKIEKKINKLAKKFRTHVKKKAKA